MSKVGIGVDIGGSGIKTAPVDLETGEFLDERYRIPTPQPATPKSVVKAVATSLKQFEIKKSTPIGVAFPGVVQRGVVRTAANMDDAWIDASIADRIEQATGHRVTAMNDADAAGYAEYKWGAARDFPGLVLLVTLGTGIGTALIADGRLVPNTELGHVIIDGLDAEEYAAESARERHGLEWDTWIPHLQRYFSEMERLLWPDLIVVGGGVSKSHHMFLPQLVLRAPIVPAELRNGAGIAGAAALAAQAAKRDKKRGR